MKSEQAILPQAVVEPRADLLLTDAKPTRLDASHALVEENISELDASATPANKGPVRRFSALDDPERKEIEALIKRMSVGDQSALSAFYDRLSPTLFGLALRMLKDEMESEDVLQEAFLYIWNKASTYNPELSSPFSWAVMIVRNKAIDRLRSRHRVEKIVERATEEFSHTLDFDGQSAEEPFFREQRGLVRFGPLPFGGLTLERLTRDEEKARVNLGVN